MRITMGLLVGLAVAGCGPGPGTDGGTDGSVCGTCPAERAVCDTSKRTCVQCLTSNDTCDAGMCVNGACVAGCATGAACASGVCQATKDCFNCTSDFECAQGRLCGTGTCSAACTTAATCPTGWDCCGGRCVDTSRDPAHCGGCGAPCTGGTFCGRSACHSATLASMCELPVAHAVLDGQTDDDSAGVSITSALAGACAPAVTAASSAQLDGGRIDVHTGRPLQLGELLVAGGGAFRQKAISWLEKNNLAPVADTSTTGLYRYSQANGTVITSGLSSAISLSHDVVVVQIATTPTGSVVLNAAGYFEPGTRAAAWYIVNQLLPVRTTLTDAWYVISWTDTNGNFLPDSTDTWSVVAQGR